MSTLGSVFGFVEKQKLLPYMRVDTDTHTQNTKHKTQCTRHPPHCTLETAFLNSLLKKNKLLHLMLADTNKNIRTYTH